MAGVSFTPKAAGRIAAVVKQVEGASSDNTETSVQRNSSKGEFWAKLTGNDILEDGRHKYAWQAVLTDVDGFKEYPTARYVRSGELEAGEDGIERYAIDVTEWNAGSIGDPLANDRVVRMFLDYYKNDEGKVRPRYSFNSGGIGPFTVYLFKDGGDDGSQTTAATWTYTAKDIDGNVLGEELVPERTRTVGRRSYAADNTRGLAEWAGSTLILLDAYKEYPGVSLCTPESP